MSWEEGQQRLCAHGFPGIELTGEVWPERSPVRGDLVCKIDSLEYRAIAKIACNYAAYVLGANWVRMPNFNELRRYVRRGTQLGRPPVRLLGSLPGRPRLAHVLAVVRQEDRLVARVTLLSRFWYSVEIAGALSVLAPIRSGHVFDIETRRIEQLQSGE